MKFYVQRGVNIVLLNRCQQFWFENYLQKKKIVKMKKKLIRRDDLIIDLEQRIEADDQKLDYLSKGWEGCEHELRKEVNHVKEKCDAKVAAAQTLLAKKDVQNGYLRDQKKKLLERNLEQAIKLKYLEEAFLWMYEIQVKFIMTAVSQDSPDPRKERKKMVNVQRNVLVKMQKKFNNRDIDDVIDKLNKQMELVNLAAQVSNNKQ